MRRWPFGSVPGRRQVVDAVVYRGPATIDGCPDAAAEALQAAGLSVDFIGPKERRRLDETGLSGCQLYVQPGGGELETAWPHIKPAKKLLRDFVRGGGGYLGFCLGAYLAGKGPGLGLLPGDTDQYITSDRASISHGGNALVTVRWGGAPRRLFFQDGPVILFSRTADVDVLATYQNGQVAAAVCRVGAGAVGVVGPHPEATPDWFADAGLTQPSPDSVDLATDLIHRTMAAVSGSAG